MFIYIHFSLLPMQLERRACHCKSVTTAVVLILSALILFLFNFSPFLTAYSGRISSDYTSSSIGRVTVQTTTTTTTTTVGSANFDAQVRALLVRNEMDEAEADNPVEAGNLSYDQLMSGRFKPFSIEGSDVIVFLHIQKTAGTTFERYLVRQLDLPQPCKCRADKKKCQCKRPNGRGFWLFSRFSTGWSCGLHADWTELVESGCVDQVLNRREHREHIKDKVPFRRVIRRYFLTAFLREPVARYLSEYRHMNRGATWSAARHLCQGRFPTALELPPCFDASIGWDGVTFDQFVACPSNLANNRQTRMLADLTKVGCYNSTFIQPESERNRLILESAKANLLKMSFFGLQEDMRRSQYIFEQTFNLQFNKVLLNWNETTNLKEFSDSQLNEVERLNALDIELYKFAKQLFYKRFEEVKRNDPLFILNIAS